ncbi:MAG: hypothetical protein IPI49_20445 [Myxococcales bacterium]|nr:hypothetical protein [Myxococcales bacterium]
MGRAREASFDGADDDEQAVPRPAVAPGKVTRSEEAYEVQAAQADHAADEVTEEASGVGAVPHAARPTPRSNASAPQRAPWMMDAAAQQALGLAPPEGAAAGAARGAPGPAASAPAAAGKRGREADEATDAGLAEHQTGNGSNGGGGAGDLAALTEALSELPDEELFARKAKLTARLSAELPRAVRLRLARQRDAVEWVQHQRQAARGESGPAHTAGQDTDAAQAAGPSQRASALDIGARGRLESALRTGGLVGETEQFFHLAVRVTGAQPAALGRQNGALIVETQAFTAELRAEAARTATQMLDAATSELHQALTQYGLAGGTFRLSQAARAYLRDPDALPQIIADWRTLSHGPNASPKASARGAAQQAGLATVVSELRAQQRKVEQLEREERGFTEADFVARDAIDPSRNAASAQAALAEAWLAAEAEHPILLAFRDPKRGADPERLGDLAAPGAGMEQAVLEQAVPKLANILRTKQELGTGRLDPLRLGPVLEVAKHKLRVPPGSARAALVAELHREATSTSLAQHVLSALSLGLSLVSFVPGVGLGAKVLAEAASLALELHAQAHEYKDWRTHGGLNNTALDMAKSVALQAPELRPLILRLAVAGANAASLAQLTRLATRLSHVQELAQGAGRGAAGAAGAADAAGAAESVESVESVLRQLDALGERVGVRHLGRQVEAVGGVRGAAVYAKKTFVKDGVSRLSRLNPEKVRDGLKRVATRAYQHGARLETKLAEASAEAASGTLRVPSPTGDLEVRLELRFKADLTPSGAHGADAGPARFSLTGGGGKQWTATVDLDQHLDPKDVEFVLGHELDEISELVRRHPGGLPAAAMEREMSASVMRQGATSAAATAHDVAHAREVVALKKDYDNLVATKSGNAPARKEVLDRAIEAAGLGDATQLDAKLRLLREAGAPEDLLHQVRGVEVRQVMGGASRVRQPRAPANHRRPGGPCSVAPTARRVSGERSQWRAPHGTSARYGLAIRRIRIRRGRFEARGRTPLARRFGAQMEHSLADPWTRKGRFPTDQGSIPPVGQRARYPRRPLTILWQCCEKPKMLSQRGRKPAPSLRAGQSRLSPPRSPAH